MGNVLTILGLLLLKYPFLGKFSLRSFLFLSDFLKNITFLRLVFCCFIFPWVIWKENEYGVVNHGKNDKKPLSWEKLGLVVTWCDHYSKNEFQSKHSSVIQNFHFPKFPSTNIDCIFIRYSLSFINGAYPIFFLISYQVFSGLNRWINPL